MNEIYNSNKQRYDGYNLLEKDTLIGMLIERDRFCNKNLTPNRCVLFTSSMNNTSGLCVNCGKHQWEH